MTNSEALSPSDCLDWIESVHNDCAGEVEYRLAMSPTGFSYPRCDRHFEQRWETQQRISRDYGVPLTYDSPSTWADEAYDY